MRSAPSRPRCSRDWLWHRAQYTLAQRARRERSGSGYLGGDVAAGEGARAVTQGPVPTTRHSFPMAECGWVCWRRYRYVGLGTCAAAAADLWRGRTCAAAGWRSLRLRTAPDAADAWAPGRVHKPANG